MYKSYENVLGHKADFRVKYKFFDFEDGGRKNLPFQGIRFDFSYHNFPNKTYIIYPEFEDENGNIILDNTVPVLNEGTASMWILNPEMRELHKSLIITGENNLGYFREGKPIAECEIIEVLDLYKNPTDW